MKTHRILLAMGSLSLLAASPRHEAFSELKFGMSIAQAESAMGRFMSALITAKHRSVLNASDVRNHFILNGTRHSGQLVAKDSLYDVLITYNSDPVVRDVSVRIVNGIERDQYLKTKEPWALFQDIADSKFDRVGKKGEFPPVEAFTDEIKEIVTDTWETEGIRIDLLMATGEVRAGQPFYYPVLRAKEIATDKPAK